MFFRIWGLLTYVIVIYISYPKCLRYYLGETIRFLSEGY